MRILIDDVRIFDGTGTPLRDGCVVVDGDSIADVAAPGAHRGESFDLVIDGNGRTLMPGMVDAHCHLTWGSSVEKIYHQFMLPPGELAIAARRNARVLLDHGFTSAYSAGALVDGIETSIAAEIESGAIPGPRLIPSTIERSPEGDDGVETGDIFHGRGAEALRGFVRHCADEGVGSIKLIVSGEDALKPDTAMDLLYDKDEMQAVGNAARDAGIFIAAHTYSPTAIGMAIDAGARILYHCSFADGETAELMARHRDEVFYAPGPGVSVAALEADPPPHVDMTHMKASAEKRIAAERKLVPLLKAKGVRVLIGGDYGFPFNPHGRNARDLENFVTLFGFTPAEALRAATQYGGELMGIDTGLVKQGYLADLLLVDGDPAKDVTILQDPGCLAMIMKGGALHKSPAELQKA